LLSDWRSNPRLKYYSKNQYLLGMVQGIKGLLSTLVDHTARGTIFQLFRVNLLQLALSHFDGHIERFNLLTCRRYAGGSHSCSLSAAPCCWCLSW